MSFLCTHCGACCNETLVQINLTFGDIARISKHLKKSIKDLFDEEIIDFNPFLDPETGNYDVELGLNKPCLLRENNKCKVYCARPLNCRLFPYWIIGKFGNETKEMFSDDYKGVANMTLNDKDILKYKEYAMEIGKILLKESKYTDLVVDKIKAELSWDPGGIDAGPFLENKQLEEKRLLAVKEMIKSADLKELKKRVAEEILTKDWQINLSEEI